MDRRKGSIMRIIVSLISIFVSLLTVIGAYFWLSVAEVTGTARIVCLIFVGVIALIMTHKEV